MTMLFRTSRLVLATILTVAVIPFPVRADPPGAFEYYLLEQSWLPEFCTGTVARKPTQMPHPECKDIESRFGATHPTVHGLWPQNDDGYPSTCAGSPGCGGGNACTIKSSNIDDAIERELEEKWMPGYPNLAAHEWKKHGTCTGLDQNDYFAATIGVASKVPVQAIPVDKIGSDVSLQDLRTWWGEPRAAFICERRAGKQYLKAIQTCWERSDDMTPGQRFECPPNIADKCSSGNKIALAKAENLGGTSPTGGGPGKKGCTQPGQGPACKNDAECKDGGWLRCAKSKCCTDHPL